MEILTVHPPALLAFTLMFVSIYLLGYLILFINWGGRHRADASSCLLSFVHGTVALLLATYSMITSQTHLNFASPNTNFQQRVLDYSIGYFFMDLLHYLIVIPSDALFIAHHLATLYVLLTCRYIVFHGATTILSLLILAEVTAPCQNTWSLTRYRKATVPAAAKLYYFLSPKFYAFYFVVRGILAPLLVYRIMVFYVSGSADDLIPRWAWISWMVVIVSAIVVSILWVLRLWIDFVKKRTKKE